MAEVNRQLIGRTTLITISDAKDVPAKVDTGADSSSIWASDVREENGTLSFKLFGNASPYYTGRRLTLGNGAFQLVRVASSSGHRQARYAVTMLVEIAGEGLQARFTLTNRETMVYPVLLGRDVLDGRFLVDVSWAIPVGLQVGLKEQKRTRVRTLRQSKRNARSRQ